MFQARGDGAMADVVLRTFLARDKAGVIENGRFAPTEEGNPQGGVASPLLLNVALHGMEQAAGVRYQQTGTQAGETVLGSPVLIRYADDLVALCHTRDEAEQVKARLTGWLTPRGLTFNEDKTRIVTLNDGFDFLGVRAFSAYRLCSSRNDDIFVAAYGVTFGGLWGHACPRPVPLRIMVHTAHRRSDLGWLRVILETVLRGMLSRSGGRISLGPIDDDTERIRSDRDPVDPGARSKPAGRSPYPWGRLIVLTVLFFAIGAGWAFSTAPLASPDENAHVFRAWTVWDGQVLLPPLDGGGARGDVPAGLVDVGDSRIACFIHKKMSDVSADCAEPWPAAAGSRVRTVVLAGRYIPTYYGLVGWPLRFAEPLTALYLMRLVSSLLSAILLALAAVAMGSRMGSAMARGAVLVCLTPMAMFLSGTVNPSGMEIAAAVCGWTGALLLVHDPTHPASRRWAATAGIGISLMVLSRPSSYLWVVPVAVVAVLMLDAHKWRILQRRPAVRVMTGAVAGSLVLAVLWSAIAEAPNVAGARNWGSVWDGLRVALEDTPEWWKEQVGVLGWLDTQPPRLVVAITAASTLPLVILAILWARRRKRLALLAALLAALLIPLASAAALYPAIGRMWQGRYSIPIAVGVVILSGVVVDDARYMDAARRLHVARWLAGLWALAGIAMVYYNLQRYMVADRTDFSFPFRATPWSGPLPALACIGVATVGYVGVVAYMLPRYLSTGGSGECSWKSV